MYIGVSGKGGTGKTTVVALIVRHLVRSGCRPVLAVDADPNSTLADKLGVTPARTIGELREAAQAGKHAAPAGVPRQRALECEVQEAITEGAGFDLLTMGRGEGPGCYCAVNNLLRQFLRDLARGYRHVVIDNEPGLEHLSRRTDHKVDLMLVVSDGTPAALKAGQRIADLARRLEVLAGPIGLVLNRLRDDMTMHAAVLPGLIVFGRVPWDPLVEQWDRDERSVLDLPDTARAVTAIREMLAGLGL